ncbi:mug158 [Symbiodinium sp. CCMP2592]|nr:mug158 [Symbiodinium sp. CCMP2592]
MVRFHKEGRLQDLVHTWRTRFLQRGLVVKDRRCPDLVFFSLGPWPTCAAALCISVQKVEAADKSVFYTLPKPLTRGHLHWKVVEKFADWQVLQTTIVSPLHAGILQKSSGNKKKPAELQVPHLPGMWRERAKNPVALLKHAAAHAYWDISSFYDEFGLAEADTDWREDDLGFALEAAVAKGMNCSPEEVASILERNIHWRCPSANEELDEILASDMLDDVLGKDAQKDVEAAQRTRQSQAVEAAMLTRAVARIRKRLRSTLGSASKSAASSSSSTRRKKVRFESNAAWSVEDLQQLLPPFYRGYKDQFNKCWRVFHKQHRWSASRSWGPSGADSRCCYKLLHMSWRRYLQLNPGETCPYEFPPEV